MDGKTLFSCFQLSEDIHHPCLWDHHGDCHTERGENTNRLRVSVLKIKHFNQPAFMYSVQLLERVKMQLASFLEDPQYQDQHSLHMEIIRTFGRVGPNAEPRFRDECT